MDTILAHENSGVASVGIMKMMGLRKSTKLAMQNGSAKYDDRHKKIKVSSIPQVPVYGFISFIYSVGH